MPREFAIPALTALALLLVAGGGGGAGSTVAEPGPGSLLLADYPVYFDEQSGLRTILGTPDLAIGHQRVGFVLSDKDGLVRLPVERGRAPSKGCQLRPIAAVPDWRKQRRMWRELRSSSPIP